MVSYASGTIRVPGLTNQGTQFDTMIQGLMKIEARQVNKLLQWRSDWQTRLDAFKQIRGELMNLQTAMKGLNSMDKFLVKSASSSDEKLVTATASSEAMNTAYEVETGQLAKYATWTKDLGLHDKNQVIADEKGSFTYSYKGIYRTVTIPKGTTVEGLMKIINNDSKNPGVKAQLIQSVDGITFQLRGNGTGQTNTLVVRGSENLKGLDIKFDESSFKYEEAENSAKLLSGFADQTALEAKLHNEDTPKTFIYTVNGTRRVIDVTKDDDIQTLVQKINKETPGIASLDWDNDKSAYFFKVEKPNSTFNITWDTGTPPASGPTMTDIMGTPSDGVNPAVPPKSFSGPNEKILADGETGGTLKFKVFSSDGTAPHNQEYSVKIDKDTTLRGLANSLQFQIGNNGTVAIKPDPNNTGKYILAVEMKDKTHRVTVEGGTLEELAYTPPEVLDGYNWKVEHAQNAQIRINGVPADGEWMEVASNSVSNVIPGMTFHLKKADSEATISVTNDTAKMTENIEKFVDAVNSFRVLLKSFTSYDETKEVTDLDYAESQFEMQKGGVLMGNYGIQLVESRLKNAVAGTSLGFLPLQKDRTGAVTGGDVFSSLSQIGIKTNANEGDSMYGLLEINFIPDEKGSKTLSQALEEDPEAVARLFATKGEGKSNSDNFHYDSHISSVTKPGTYNVSYTMSDDGSYIASATINGAQCSIDQENGIITCKEGAARGLAIKIGENDPMKTYTGTVSIRDGKINEIIGLLDGTEGILGTNGTLRNLEDNYNDIIKGIEDKIKRENDRLERFQKTMTLKFARLEEVLSRYDGIQASLEQSLSQLNSNSKK